MNELIQCDTGLFLGPASSPLQEDLPNHPYWPQILVQLLDFPGLGFT